MKKTIYSWVMLLIATLNYSHLAYSQPLVDNGEASADLSLLWKVEGNGIKPAYI